MLEGRAPRGRTGLKTGTRRATDQGNDGASSTRGRVDEIIPYKGRVRIITTIFGRQTRGAE